jgi:hypothetical protein
VPFGSKNVWVLAFRSRGLGSNGTVAAQTTWYGAPIASKDKRSPRLSGLLPPAALRLGILRHREIPFNNLGKRDLITPCEFTQNLVSIPGELDDPVAAGISPRRPDHRLQLFPLSCIEKPVTPALQGLDSRFFVRELVPRREPRPVLWPRIVSQPFTNPPVHPGS